MKFSKYEIQLLRRKLDVHLDHYKSICSTCHQLIVVYVKQTLQYSIYRNFVALEDILKKNNITLENKIQHPNSSFVFNKITLSKEILFYFLQVIFIIMFKITQFENSIQLLQLFN